MNEKVVDGIIVREVRPGVWVSQQGEVWKENVLVPRNNGLAPLITSRWYKPRRDKQYHRRFKIPCGKYGTILRYRLVAMAWIPNPRPELYDQVNHLDGNPTNDVASNLEWCDNSHNVQHAYDMGLNDSTKNRDNQDKRKFTDVQEREIYLKYGDLPKGKFNRMDLICEEFDCSRSMVKKIIRNNRSK